MFQSEKSMTEKEMIEKMESKAFVCHQTLIPPKWILIDNAIEIAREYAASQNQQNQWSRWISVNDMLPNKRVRVQVSDGKHINEAWMDLHGWVGWRLPESEEIGEIIKWRYSVK